MSSSEYLSHDSVIPMNMWFDKKLDPLDVKTYAIIRGLSNKFGYCFATNTYLAETCGIGESTIRRSLAVLKNNGYLEIETDKNGIHWQRRIYISDKFKKSLRRATDEHPPAQMRAPPCSNASTITNTIPNKEYSKETPPTPSKGERVIYGKFVALNKEEFESLRELIGSTNALSELINEMNDYLSSSGKKPYKDYAAAIRLWFRRRESMHGSKMDSRANKAHPKESKEGENRAWWGKWSKLAHPFVREGLIYDGPDYVSFAKEGSHPVKIYYRDAKFQEICENEFRKIGLFA